MTLLPLFLALTFFAVTLANSQRNCSALVQFDWEDSPFEQSPESANPKEYLEHTKNSLDLAKDLVSIYTADNFVKKIVTTSIMAVAHMLSGALTVISAIISVIMGIITSVDESPELLFMREQFREVHSKLDGITLQLDEVKRLIEWRTTRGVYAGFEIFIQATTTLMDDYIAAPAADRELRKRKFVDAFKRNPSAALKLYQAITSNNHIIADNIATAAVHYTRNHRKQVMDFLLAMQRLIMRGAQLEIAYERLEHGEAATKTVEKDWKIRMQNLVARMKAIDDQIVQVWHQQFTTDVDEFILEKRDLQNKEFACAIQSFLSSKYHWRHWFALAYNPVGGFDNHAMSQCGGLHRFRTSQGTSRNLVLESADPETSRFTQAKGDAWLAAAESARHRTTDALTWLNEINRRVGNACDDAAFRGVICWGCNVWDCSDPTRRSYRKINVAGNVNAFVFG